MVWTVDNESRRNELISGEALGPMLPEEYHELKALNVAYFEQDRHEEDARKPWTSGMDDRRNYLINRVAGGILLTTAEDSELKSLDQSYVEYQNARKVVPVEQGVDPMTFGAALLVLKAGGKVARTGWNGPGQYIQLQTPDEIIQLNTSDGMSKMTLPYIFICTVQVELIPWLASQADILAEDWKVV